MTAELGFVAIAVSWAASVYAAAASAIGAARGEARLVESGRRGLVAATVLASASVGALVVAFFTRDYSIAYVWQHSGGATPPAYLLSCLWAGQEGSLLFWGWLLSLWSAAACTLATRADHDLMAWVGAVLAAILAFFLWLCVFVANPFVRLDVVPADGNGLNPLLAHPGMALHPPFLYLGFTGLAVPYAFGIAALLSRRTDAAWLLASRRWTLAAWCLLTIGLALGARWAYDVLGWGGYWGWDPVENAALMPWISATALVHSAVVQERRGLFAVWNMALLILTFGLVVLGTFLTRAGLVSSVHSFARSEIGPAFLLFTGAVLLGGFWLLWRGLDDLRTNGRVEGALSREGTFLANNLIFVGALFGVFWGTMFPLLSELATGQRVTVGPPYFNRVVLPVLWLAVGLMAVAPAVGWGPNRPGRIARSLGLPIALALALAVTAYVAGVRVLLPLAALTTCALVVTVVVTDFARASMARARRGESPLVAATRLLARSRRRYGGYIVHVGVAMLAVGVIGSGFFQARSEKSLGPGEAMDVGGYVLRRGSLVHGERDGVRSTWLELEIARGDESAGTLRPRRDVHPGYEDQPVTVPAVLHRPMEDVYVILGMVDEESDRVTLKALLIPAMAWLWTGMAVMVAGTAIAAWPDPRERRAYAVDVAEERVWGADPAERRS